MTHSIALDRKTYVLTYPDNTKLRLPLVTSIAFYNAAMPSLREIAWKIEAEDGELLKLLIQSAKANPSDETFRNLSAMETFYNDLQGRPPADATPAQAASSRASRNDNQADYMTKGIRAESLDIASDEHVDLSFIGKDGPVYSIGDLAELKQKLDGKSRNAYRTRKPKA